MLNSGTGMPLRGSTARHPTKVIAFTCAGGSTVGGRRVKQWISQRILPRQLHHVLQSFTFCECWCLCLHLAAQAPACHAHLVATSGASQLGSLRYRGTSVKQPEKQKHYNYHLNKGPTLSIATKLTTIVLQGDVHAVGCADRNAVDLGA